MGKNQDRTSSVTFSANGEFAAIFAALEKINHRLDKIEAVQQASRLGVGSLHTNDPSLEKFAIAEAVADAIFGAKPDEKTCTFEPNGRPCDHCSMCSARGF